MKFVGSPLCCEGFHQDLQVPPIAQRIVRWTRDAKLLPKYGCPVMDFYPVQDGSLLLPLMSAGCSPASHATLVNDKGLGQWMDKRPNVEIPDCRSSTVLSPFYRRSWQNSHSMINKMYIVL